eukprot:1880371-Prorocentrum_lima.AAC.1
MTSSLVGSEMCIRDRIHITILFTTVVLHAMSEAENCSQLEKMIEWHGTVSYTHLTLPTICSV